MPRVMHVIAGLEVGGAETMLHKLLVASRGGPWEHEVVSMTNAGPMGLRMRAMGVPVFTLNMRNGFFNPIGLVRLVRLIRRRRPSLIQTWMYHADFLGGAAAKLVGRIPVIWGIRQSDIRIEKMVKKVLARLINPLLSHVLPEYIVCCAEEARRIHLRYGYVADKLRVIPNGFELTRFSADPNRRREARSALNVTEDELIVGMVGRLHALKDHRNFIRAVSSIGAKVPHARFLLCGAGLTPDSRELALLFAESGVEPSKFLLLGQRDDVEQIYPVMDVNVLSSLSEGFPNVLGEAMACEVPCVATDVGDAALIIGSTGRVVPPQNPDALAAAIVDLLTVSEEKRRSLGQLARRRIEEHFSIEAVAGQYQALYEEVLAGRPKLRGADQMSIRP